MSQGPIKVEAGPDGKPLGIRSTAFQGQRVWITLADREGSEVGGEGPYYFVVTLCRFDASHGPNPAVNFDPEMEGDSFVRLGQHEMDKVPPLYLTIGGQKAKLDLHPNRFGRLHRIVIESLVAKNFEDAERIGYQAVVAMLATWSSELDLPFLIARVLLIEHRTGYRRATWTAPFRESALLIEPGRSCSVEFRVYAGLYREAIGTNSPIYQFLCLYKIIDGLQQRRSSEAARRASKGEPPIRLSRDRVPSDLPDQMAWLHYLFPIRREWDAMTLAQIFWPEAIGKKFTTVSDQILRPLRNIVGHVIEEGGEPTLLLDHLPQISKVDRWSPLARCIARQLMREEFPDEFLAFTNEKGNLVEGEVVILGAEPGEVSEVRQT